MTAKLSKSIMSGLLATLATAWLLGKLMPGSSHDLYIAYVKSFFGTTASFAVGGLVARRGFLPAAVTVAASVIIGIVLHTAYLVGEANYPVFPVLTRNLPIIAIVILGAIVGSKIGMWCSERIPRRLGSAS